MFWIAASISFFATFEFISFGSGQEQPWNREWPGKDGKGIEVENPAYQLEEPEINEAKGVKQVEE